MSSKASVDRLDVNGLSIAYRAAGDGPRTVLVHGLAQDHTIWSEVQGLWPDARTYAYDLRGHGATPLGHPQGTLAQLGQDLIGLLERLGPAMCVGFSLGGSVALWVAAERPDLVTAVVAVATSSVVGRAAAGSMRERIAEVEAGGVLRLHEVLADDTRSQLAGDEARLDKILAARWAATTETGGYLNGARAVCDMHDHPLQERLDAVTQPVLVVSGSLDPWCPPRAAQIMLERLAHAQFVELAGVGHLVTDVAAGELVAIVRDWNREREQA